MTFSIIVPNATQSPSVFPAQNNTNYSRLKDIINADHNFVDTSDVSEGSHNQVTFIDRSAPVAVPVGTNSMLYSTSDVASTPIPNFFDGSQNHQIPFAVSGSVALANGASSIVYTNTNTFFGTGFVAVSTFVGIFEYRILTTNTIISSGFAGVVIFNTGGNISITNNSGALATLIYSLIINVIA
jgi:hypothetical protein